jgi:hypothetical protein
MILSRLPLLSQSRARAARRDTCTLNSVTSCPQVLILLAKCSARQSQEGRCSGLFEAATVEIVPEAAEINGGGQSYGL